MENDQLVCFHLLWLVLPQRAYLRYGDILVICHIHIVKCTTACAGTVSIRSQLMIYIISKYKLKQHSSLSKHCLVCKSKTFLFSGLENLLVHKIYIPVFYGMPCSYLLLYILYYIMCMVSYGIWLYIVTCGCIWLYFGTFDRIYGKIMN